MRIILADDHILFKDTLSEYIKRKLPNVEMTMAADYYAVEEILENGMHPDLVMLDLNMPGMEKIKGLKKLRSERPEIKVAVISGWADEKTISQTLDLGAIAYFPKTMPGSEFVIAIKAISEGKKYIPVSENSAKLAPAYLTDDDPSCSYEEVKNIAENILTDRERDVMRGLLEGLANKEIARALNIQEVTIKLHVSNICNKLNVENRTQAALKARDLGFKYQ